jgi:hypothetical protein
MCRSICIAVAALFAAAPTLSADVAVSVSMGQPGFYGRIDIGDVPHPDLISPQPIIIKAIGAPRAPMYFHVPPGHAKDWAKHCGKYNACGERVFFVKTQWYNSVYVPHHQKRQARIEAAEREMLTRGQGQGPGEKPAKEKGKNKSN